MSRLSFARSSSLSRHPATAPSSGEAPSAACCHSHMRFRRRWRARCAAPQRGEGEVQPRPVSRREAQVAEGERVDAAALDVRQDERVAGRLGHLDAVGEQVLAVDPRVDDRAAGVSVALGDLALVVWEDVVDAAGVDVEPGPQVLDRHGRALDVPSGEAVAPPARPLQLPSRLGLLPQREVAHVSLARVGLYADRLQQRLLLDVARQGAVAGGRRHAVVDVAVDLVGEPFRDQALDDLQHLVDVARGPREVVCRDDVELAFVAQEAGGVCLGDLRRRLSRRERRRDHLVLALLQRLLAHVADVGDVLDVEYAQALQFQRAPDPVGHQV